MSDPRKPIFDAVKAARGGKQFESGEVGALDNLLDTLGVPRGSEPTADLFTRALAEILHHEGGYVNHPKDPGGRTMLGVTQRVWEQWTGKPSSEAEMRALTPAKVAPLYRKNYWEVVGCDKLPAGLALCLFDFAVNAGPARAARYLQRMVGAAQDGKIGPQTLAAVTGYVQSHGEPATIRAFQDARRAYYRSLSTFATFGKGWLRRVDEVERAALEIAA